MFFIDNEDVGESVTAAAPQRKILKVLPGYLLHYDVHLTSGTDVTSTLKVLYHGTQILPKNRDENLVVTSVGSGLPDMVPILTAPFDLELLFTNANTSHNVVHVGVLIVEPEMMNIRSGAMLG
jgi:hypothetical protein